MSQLRTFRVRVVRMKEKKNWKPGITDHAVIRYLERSMSLDVESLRERMRTPALRQAMLTGAHSVSFEDVKLVIVGSNVVTVLDGPKKAVVKKHPKPPTRKQRELMEMEE